MASAADQEALAEAHHTVRYLIIYQRCTSRLVAINMKENQITTKFDTHGQSQKTPGSPERLSAWSV